MTGDRLIRFVATLAVLAVAGIAAVVSFNHVGGTVALVNGQSLVAARLLPASVDGAILAASMVMLDSARRDAHTPVLARVMLVAAILATLAANSAAGAAHGPVGIMVSAWPAVAFIGSAELLLAMVRLRSQTAPEAPVAEPLPSVPGQWRAFLGRTCGRAEATVRSAAAGPAGKSHPPLFSGPRSRPGRCPASGPSSGSATSARTWPQPSRTSSPR